MIFIYVENQERTRLERRKKKTQQDKLMKNKKQSMKAATKTRMHLQAFSKINRKQRKKNHKKRA